MRQLLAPLLLLTSVAIAAPGDRLFISGSVVNIRAHPDANAEIVTKVSRGQELMEFGRDGDWIAVGVIGSGKDGHVHKSLVSSERPKVAASNGTTSDYERFEAAFQQLNDSIYNQYEIRLFSGSRYKGDGIVEITATANWIGSSADNQESSLKTVFQMWDAAEGTGLPVAVYVVDESGKHLTRIARR